MISIVILILIALLSYLLGSLNFGIIISRKFKKEDIRTHGSGNAGSTNMLRNYGKAWGVATILGDMAKVAVAILIAFAILKCTHQYEHIGKMSDNADMLIKSFAGFFCVLGHIFPCFFNFKGGKGVATSGGMVFMIDWRIALILLAVFIVAVALTKYVSLGSILMAIFYPVFIGIFYKDVILVLIAILFAAIVITAHRGNISKLLNGTESKISDKKRKK
ncbi:MAG: glycerol-3-phosphate 1-O-acyltransferase PlsY [Eubacterium sp.]